MLRNSGSEPNGHMEPFQELAPVRLGDPMRWKRDPFGYYGDMVGIVIKTDVPVARAWCRGYDSLGIIEVEFPGGYRGSSHWSNFEKENVNGTAARRARHP